MTQPFDLTQSLERLEGQRWPDPPRDTTSLVKVVHALRRRPVGDLRPDELARLITQDVGLPWLLPIAVRILRDTAPGQAAGGWYDDDLLYTVVTRNPRVWEQFPDLAHELRRAVETLVDLSRSVRDEAETALGQVMRALPAEKGELGEWWRRKPVRAPWAG
ncbi:contact-dependent growth inhibition system immunity protein [Streptomyces parvulus]|uniref:contact-dependent growth inhibition system immunity protein n=1 Tax=Streptomyces parvulus TaxID=146923 RepID=UPI0033E79A50